MHLEHRMDDLPTPVRHTAHGNLPESCRISSPSPEAMNFVLVMFTWRPLDSNPFFHALTRSTHSSREVAMITRSSAKNSSQGTPRGGTRVHHGRVGSAGLCDLKILHPWRRLKKGVKILQWPPPNARKGGSIFYISMKSLQKRGSKIYNSKKYRGQNSTSLKMGVKILHAEK